jgi:hypothetical protein
VLVDDIGVMKELGNNVRAFNQSDTNISMVISVLHLIWFSRSSRTSINCGNKKTK